MRVEAVLFDLFDTLLPIESGEDFYIPCLKKTHEFLVRNGVDVSFEDFSHVYFEVRDELYAKAEKNLEEPHFNMRICLTLQRLGYDFGVSDAVVVRATEVFADEFMRYVSLDENAISVLQKLSRNYKFGIVSNFAIPECVEKLLKKYGLENFFSVIVISGAINRRKPSPEIFEKALNALSVDASKAIFVGDTLSMDVNGAKKVGMKAVLIERKASAIDKPKSLLLKQPKDNAHLKPDKVIKSLEELLVVIKDC